MKWTGFLPFEVLYRHPLIKGIQGDLKEISDLTLRQQMQALSKINDWIWKILSISLTTHTHPYKPADAT
jgi:hypothetical protein